MKTMHEKYGEPDDEIGKHEVCTKCGLCITCGDCECEPDIYAISDTHFNHLTMILLRWRKFKSVEHMNEFIIEQWNKTISHKDTIYHLGDVALNKKEDFVDNILPRLNGKIIFLQGNHCPNSISMTQNIIIKWQGNHIEMTHRPEDITGKCKYNIVGHIHKSGIRSMPKGAIKHKDYLYELNGKIYFIVNLEFHKYKPRKLREIIGEMKHLRKK